MSRPSSGARGYNVRWQKYREKFLARHPLCRFCKEAGRLTRATVVDHIRPHRGDSGLFWDKANHQALCKACHDGAKQSQERTGQERGCDPSGAPNDPGHHWNRG
jgi:5-methylcytosine-specific restriction enzyme A